MALSPSACNLSGKLFHFDVNWLTSVRMYFTLNRIRKCRFISTFNFRGEFSKQANLLTCCCIVGEEAEVGGRATKENVS